MGLTNKKEEQLRRMPVIQTRFSKSKDGRYLIHQTTITTIRPIAYFEKVIASDGTIEQKEVQETIADDPLVINGEDLVK